MNDMRSASVVMALLLGSAGCGAARPVGPVVPDVPLVEPQGATIDVHQLIGRAPLTVFVFFSRACHCLNKHDPRILALYDAYRERGVQLVMVDSEVRGSPEGDAEEAKRRSYPFPILIDRQGKLAEALRAEYATYSVVVDAKGQVRYHGGFDSDKTHLRDDAIPYVKNALDDLLAGKEPRQAEAKTLGCALETW